MTHLGPRKGVDQAVPADVWEAVNAGSDALRCAQFIRLEAEQRTCCFSSEVCVQTMPGHSRVELNL
jgi:hypothetical protein